MNGNIWCHWRNIYTHYTNVTNICTYILHTYYTKYLLINLIKTPTCAISVWDFPSLLLGLPTYYMSTCRYLLSIMCQQSTCSQQTKDVTHHCHEVHELNDFSNTEAWWNTYLTLISHMKALLPNTLQLQTNKTERKRTKSLPNLLFQG